MPDQFGLDHLGTTLRCVECGQRWKTWELSLEEREQHRAAHRHPGAATVPTGSLRTQRRHSSKLYVETHRERHCAYEFCANTFIPVRTTRRFCSDACRKRSERHAKRPDVR